MIKYSWPKSDHNKRLSLYYTFSNVFRLIIERTSSPPVDRPQIRGDFISEEERIANLFVTSKKKGRTK